MNFTGWKKPSLDDPIQFIKGVGPKKALLLQKLQLTNIEDLLYFLPFRYEDRSQFKKISTLMSGEFGTIIAEVLTAGIIYISRRKRIFEVIFQDETGTTRAKWFRFNETYMLEKGNVTPNVSGRQEFLENLINEFI